MFTLQRRKKYGVCCHAPSTSDVILVPGSPAQAGQKEHEEENSKDHVKGNGKRNNQKETQENNKTKTNHRNNNSKAIEKIKSNKIK